MANQSLSTPNSKRTWLNPGKATLFTSLLSTGVYILIWIFPLQLDPNGWVGIPISACIPVVLGYPRIRYANKLMREVEELNERLSEQNVLREKLLAIIGHDVRGPLASLAGLVDLMDSEGMSPAEFKKWLDKVRPELEFTRETLDRLVYWAKLQMTGIVEDKEFRLGEIRSIVESNANQMAAGRNIDITFDWDQNTFISGDRMAIQITLSNLLHNAVKHSPDNSSVSVRSETGNKEIMILIEDSGQGITQSELNQLFLGPIDKNDHYATGLGVGLFLCKEFVQMNGGTITAENVLGGGARFCITLKLA